MSLGDNLNRTLISALSYHTVISQTVSDQFSLFGSTACVLIKVTDYSSSSEDSESSDDDGETVGHDGTVAVSDIPRIM